MNVSIDARWEKFIEEAVQDGRYSSASDVVREGLRLVQEREAKLSALRDTLQRQHLNRRALCEGAAPEMPASRKSSGRDGAYSIGTWSKPT